MRAADAIIEVLHQQGIDIVFGLPGGANLPLYDALFDGQIRHILCRHEQGAGHAAEGYAKASGRVGVALATSGPGATNLVTAIADAHLDSVATVFITGQVKTELIGTDAFQEADIYGITLPLVKHSYSLRRPEEIVPAVREAFHLARSGRPGPVLVDIPSDLFRAEVKAPEPPSADALPGYRPHYQGHERQIRRAAAAIAVAQRPVFYIGGGVIAADASDQLRRLVELTAIPTTSTLMALGAYPSTGPAWLGMLGMHGTRAANYAVDEADLLVSVAARFDDRVTGRLDQFSPQAKIIHIDVDPAEIDKNVTSHIPVVGDCRAVLAALADALEPGLEPDRLDDWRRRIDDWKQKHPLPAGQQGGQQIAPQALIDALARAAPEAIITSDVGQHQMWCAQRFPFNRPRQWINSGGLGTMGFGLPAAIGAQLACPQETVVCVAGDGSLAMSAPEIASAVEAQAPIKIIVVNNAGYGMVRQWQRLFWDERYSQVQLGQSTNWPLVAQGFGAQARQISDPDQLDEALAWLLDRPGVALLDVIVADDDVYPMIPAGAAARDMIG